MHRLRKAFTSPFASGLIGGVAALAIGVAAIATGLISVDNSDEPEATTVAQGPIVSDAQPAAVDNGTAGRVYREDGQGVAFIEAVQDSAGEPAPFDQGPGGGAATGSGLLIDHDGHVMTNAHVVDGSSSVTVKFGEGDALDAEVLGVDDSTDIAVLRVDPAGLDAEPLELGDSDAVEVGDPAVAIGNPYGLDRTVTTGIISALQRQISAPNGFTISDVLQTDAAINPGNSGGPLIDAEGRVIGINSQIATGAQGQGSVGIGFAVPINTAKDVASQIIDGGSVEHAYLGIEGGDLTPELADTLNLDVEAGALIQRVTPDGPADQAGLEGGDATVSGSGGGLGAGGDVVTAADGEPVAGMEDLIGAIDGKEPGETITLDVIRDGEEQQVEVVLGNRPSGATD
jgi:S1-C subfamily serine protease